MCSVRVICIVRVTYVQFKYVQYENDICAVCVQFSSICAV